MEIKHKAKIHWAERSIGAKMQNAFALEQFLCIRGGIFPWTARGTGSIVLLNFHRFCSLCNSLQVFYIQPPLQLMEQVFKDMNILRILCPEPKGSLLLSSLLFLPLLIACYLPRQWRLFSLIHKGAPVFFLVSVVHYLPDLSLQMVRDAS